MNDLSTRLVGLAVLVVVCVVIGRLARARNGRVRAVAAGAVPLVSADDLHAPLGEVATLVQFSTVVCTPCRATSRLLAGIAGEVPGIVHVEVDAEQRVDLARRFEVLRAPTVLVVDASGLVVSRSSGVPDPAAVRAVLAGLPGVRPADPSVVTTPVVTTPVVTTSVVTTSVVTTPVVTTSVVTTPVVTTSVVTTSTVDTPAVRTSAANGGPSHA